MNRLVGQVLLPWANRVIPFWADGMRLQAELAQFLPCDLPPFLVDVLVEVGLHGQARLRRRPSNVAQHDLQRAEWASFPILADLAEQLVLDWIRSEERRVGKEYR